MSTKFGLFFLHCYLKVTPFLLLFYHRNFVLFTYRIEGYHRRFIYRIAFTHVVVLPIFGLWRYNYIKKKWVDSLKLEREEKKD